MSAEIKNTNIITDGVATIQEIEGGYAIKLKRPSGQSYIFNHAFDSLEFTNHFVSMINEEDAKCDLRHWKEA